MPGRRRSGDPAARAQPAQRERDPAPLQPVEQPRQLLRAPRRHQQRHPQSHERHRPGRAHPPQCRVTGDGGDDERVEPQPGQQPHRRGARRGPAQLPLVPPAPGLAPYLTAPLGGGGTRGGGTVRAMTEQPPTGPPGYAALTAKRIGCPGWGRTGAFRSTKMFARSGGNPRTPHGLSVIAGKTSLVGRGDTQATHVSRSPSAYWRLGYWPGLREHRLAPSGWRSCRRSGRGNRQEARPGVGS